MTALKKAHLDITRRPMVIRRSICEKCGFGTATFFNIINGRRPVTEAEKAVFFSQSKNYYPPKN
jgi:hypothetical protein